MAKGHLCVPRYLYDKLVAGGEIDDEAMAVRHFLRKGSEKGRYLEKGDEEVQMFMDHPDFIAADFHADTITDKYTLVIEPNELGKLVLTGLQYHKDDNVKIVKSYV